MAYLLLAAAIVNEVAATLALRQAAAGGRRWYIAVIAGYLAASIFLTLTLGAGLGLAVAYGVWVAVGVALTALASKFLFKEPLTALMGAGIALIMGGVLLIELGAPNH